MEGIKMKKLAILLSFFGYSVPLFAQLPGAIHHSPLPTVHEKIFVHTDKSFYVAGEIIWFKLYVRDQSVRPARVSRVAYVEIIGANRQPILQAKIALDEGTGSGSFHLPYSIQSGNCYLRAYTSWMRNNGPAYFFEKPLVLVNTLKTGLAGTQKEDRYDIQFFPQGGYLVQGLENIIAFKATGRDGKGVACSGFILSAQDDTLQQFRTFRYGMGRFAFRPETTVPYEAWIQLPDTLVRVPLPAALAAGYTLRMRQEDDSIIVTAQTNHAQRPLYLEVHSAGKEVFHAAGTWEGDQMRFTIPHQLPAGISRLTVLNESMQPLCERLYFRKPGAGLNISVHLDKENYGVREPVPLRIATTAMNGDSAAANLSLSVYLVDELQAAEQENMAHYFWLGAELKGTVEDQAFYFSDDAAVAEATENLLLTQGWRRIEAIQPLQQQPAFLPEWEGPVVMGRIGSKNGTRAPHNQPAFLSFTGERFQLATAVSDSSGNLRFITRNFYGRGDVVVQPADSNFYVTLTDPFSDVYSETRIPSLRLSEELSASLNRRSIGSQLQNQFAADSIARFAMAAADTTAFYGLPDKQYLLDDYTRFTTMEEVLREFVAEVRLRKSSDRYQFQVRNHADMQFFDQPPLLLLDGVPVTNSSSLVAFSPLQIKKIDVVARRYIYGAYSYPGIVSFTTYQGNLSDFILPASAHMIPYEGMQWQRVFYAPVYETPAQKESRLPDFRNQLQWIPNLETSASGTASTLFYTSDLPGKFAVVLHGITATGLPGSAIHFIEVRKQ